MDEIYKSTAKKLNALLLICNELFPIANDRIVDKITPEIIRTYSVFATSLNLLIGYCASFNYNRKKLSLIYKKAKREFIEKICIKLVSLLDDCISQFAVLHNAILEFARAYDTGTKKKDEISGFADVAAFLKAESEPLSKINLTAKNKALLASVTKTGSFDSLDQNMKTMQSKLSQFYGASEPYKVTIGGFDYSKTARGGNKEVLINDDLQKIKSCILKSQMLRSDLAEPPSADYYDMIFLEKLGEIMTLLKKSPQSDSIAELRELAAKSAKEQFADYLIDNPINVNYRKQTETVLKSNVLQDLIKYCAERGAQLNLPEKLDFDLILKIFDQIDAADAKIIHDNVDREFAELEKIKNISDLTDMNKTLVSNIATISEPDFAPGARHDLKQQIRAYIANLKSFHHDEGVSYSLKIAYVKPMALNFDNPREKMSQILDVVDYIIDIQSQFIPVYRDLKKRYDDAANILRKLFMAINSMVVSENKTTCIKKPALLIKSIIRAHMLPIIAKKRKLQKKELATFDWPDKIVYTKQGINSSSLEKLINKYIN